MSLLIGASLALIAATPPADLSALPPPPPIERSYAPSAPALPSAAPAISEELRAYLETRGARPARHRSGSIVFEDYPAAAMRAGEQGTVTFRYAIGAEGRVTSCEVVESSGSAILDSTTCALAQRRFRFFPAQDDQGNPVGETRTQSVRYSFPVDPEPVQP